MLCWFACQRAALFRATVLALRERPIPASSAPLGVYIYAFGDESCRNRLAIEGSAPLVDIACGDSASLRGIPASARNKAAHGTLGSSARCSGSRPHSPSLPLRVGQRTALTTDKRRLPRSLRRRSRRLRGDTRRYASSAGYRLLALRRVSPRIRRTASLHVAQFGTRPLVPCLTFHKARFFRSSCARRRPVSSLNLVVSKVPRRYPTLIPS